MVEVHLRLRCQGARVDALPVGSTAHSTASGSPPSTVGLELYVPWWAQHIVPSLLGIGPHQLDQCVLQRLKLLLGDRLTQRDVEVVVAGGSRGDRTPALVGDHVEVQAVVVGVGVQAPQPCRLGLLA